MAFEDVRQARKLLQRINHSFSFQMGDGEIRRAIDQLSGERNHLTDIMEVVQPGDDEVLAECREAPDFYEAMRQAGRIIATISFSARANQESLPRHITHAYFCRPTVTVARLVYLSLARLSPATRPQGMVVKLDSVIGASEPTTSTQCSYRA